MFGKAVKLSAAVAAGKTALGRRGERGDHLCEITDAA